MPLYMAGPSWPRFLPASALASPIAWCCRPATAYCSPGRTPVFTFCGGSADPGKPSPYCSPPFRARCGMAPTTLSLADVSPCSDGPPVRALSYPPSLWRDSNPDPAHKSRSEPGPDQAAYNNLPSLTIVDGNETRRWSLFSNSRRVQISTSIGASMSNSALKTALVSRTSRGVSS